MPRQIYINICVKDIVASTAFYTAVGATKDDRFSNETVSAMAFSDTIIVMIMTPEIFNGFKAPSKTLADSHKTSEVLLCIGIEKKEEVDQILDAAEKAGGTKDPTVMPQMPGMYGRSFEDLDGHHWELVHMDMAAAQAECEPKEKDKKLKLEYGASGVNYVNSNDFQAVWEYGSGGVTG